MLTCRHPDRDCAKLMCGRPLPCPFHTAIIHADKQPPTVEIPLTATAALEGRHLLAQVAGAVAQAAKETQ